MFLIKFSELFLHGVRRGKLVRALIKRIGELYPDESIENLSGRIVLHSDEDRGLSRVFGVYKYTKALELKQLSPEEISKVVPKNKTYKVEVRKTSSTLKKNSINIAKEVAEGLYSLGYELSVRHPEEIINIEVRNDRYFLYLGSWEKVGPGGFPYGSYGRALVLYSGGFDSPVASWLAARKGLALDFLVIPFNEDMEKEVLRSWRKLCSEWNIEGNLYSIKSCPINTGILSQVPRGIKQIVLKKSFYYLASRFAGDRPVITGESLNQTSTQRASLLAKIQHGIEGTFMRPLLTYTKEEIMELSKSIGMYEISKGQKEYCSIEKLVKEEATKDEIMASFERIRPLLDVLEPSLLSRM